MFTGVILGTCGVISVEQKPNLVAFVVDLGDKLSKNLKIGSSVSVDGVCLSAIEVVGTRVTFEALQETLNRTALAALAPERLRHIERSASAADEVREYRVSGHVH